MTPHLQVLECLNHARARLAAGDLAAARAAIEKAVGVIDKALPPPAQE